MLGLLIEEYDKILDTTLQVLLKFIDALNLWSCSLVCVNHAPVF